ncbi:hypothetical protein [Shinella sp.]|uniref:hypothetical protein n=1 Tax=Shinella sp. TaxID=1870904 RepID=UPI00258BEF89|nr:hypothetical protein [Shinella sp.]MCW5706766.1 hypothetical protein [Shinella sp.]
MISTTPSNRDFSELSALLAKAAAAPAKAVAKTAPTRKAVPANDNKVADVLAWPTLERLAHRRDAARVYALRHWRNMCHPGSEFVPTVDEDESEELEMEIRPSEAELLGAIGWRVIGKERWHHNGKVVNIYSTTDATPASKANRLGGTDTQIGDLVFRDGNLIKWGETKKGAALRPVNRPRGVKGGATAGRTEAAIWSYIKLPAAGASPLAATSLRRPISDAPAIITRETPLPREEPSAKDCHGRFGVEEARTVLQEFGVDGSVPFERLPLPAIMCPDAVVAGPQWVGGIKKPKPLGEISQAAGSEPEVVHRIETLDWITHLRRLLGEHAKVLDMAITDASAKKIGIEMKKAPAYVLIATDGLDAPPTGIVVCQDGDALRHQQRRSIHGGS